MNSNSTLSKALYRAICRWTHEPCEKEIRFIVPLLSQQFDLVAKQCMTHHAPSMQTLRKALREHMRTPCLATDKRVDAGFAALRELSGLSEMLHTLRDEREGNRDRTDVQFRVGTVMQHAKFGFRGVITGWDRRPILDVSGWDGVVTTARGSEQPFYHVLPDLNDCHRVLGGARSAMYVAEDNVEPLEPKRRRVWHVSMPLVFHGYDEMRERFVPCDRLRYQYPCDSEDASASTNDGAKEGVVDALSRADVAARTVGSHVDALLTRLRSDFTCLSGITAGNGTLEDAAVETPLFNLYEVRERLRSHVGITDPFHKHPKRPVGGRKLLDDCLAAASGIPAPAYECDEAHFPPGMCSMLHLHGLMLLVEVLVNKRKNTTRCTHESNQQANPRYRVGQVLNHSKFGFKGVVAGWDRRPVIDVSMWDGVVSTPRGTDQPFYHIVPCQHDCENGELHDAPSRGLPQRYVAEDNLEPLQAHPAATNVIGTPTPSSASLQDVKDGPVNNAEVLNALFDGFCPSRQEYAPSEMLLCQYPHDGDDCVQEESASLAMTLDKFSDAIQDLFRERIAAPDVVQMLLDMLPHARSKEDADLIEQYLRWAWDAQGNAEAREHFDAGDKALERKNYADAAAHFSSALSADDSFVAALSKRAECHWEMQDYAAVLRDTELILLMEPRHCWALEIRAQLLQHDRKLLEASETLCHLLEINPWASGWWAQVDNIKLRLAASAPELEPELEAEGAKENER